MAKTTAKTTAVKKPVNKNTREKLIARGQLRFPKMAESHTGALILSRYFKFGEEIELLDDQERGLLVMKNYDLFDELLKRIFADDYDAVIKVTDDKIEKVMEIIQTVMTSPLISSSLPSSAGAEVEKD